MEKKNVLIINYVFPPYPGIGGRRWAKLAKHLHRNGYNIHVIAAKNPFDYTSTFINNIKYLPKENLHYLPALYPKALISSIKTIKDKLAYQCWYRVLPFLVKGNYYDRSTFWKLQLQNQVEKLIKEKDIQIVIVSVPPFHYAYYTVLLKEKYPHIKFIVDYRDEWTFNNVHGFAAISNQRQNREKTLEKYTCEKADYISSCTAIILAYIKTLYQVDSKKLIHLPHFFDEDDFTSNQTNIRTTDKTVFFYAGTVHENKEIFFKKITETLDYLKEKYPALYEKIEFHFYAIGEFKDHYYRIIQRHKDKIKINLNLSTQDLFSLTYLSDFLFILSHHRAKDYFTTKFAEMIYLKKTLLYYGNEGLVSKYITENKLGIHLKDDTFIQQVINLLENQYQFSFSDELINEWNIKKVIEKIETTIT